MSNSAKPQEPRDSASSSHRKPLPNIRDLFGRRPSPTNPPPEVVEILRRALSVRDTCLEKIAKDFEESRIQIQTAVDHEEHPCIRTKSPRYWETPDPVKQHSFSMPVPFNIYAHTYSDFYDAYTSLVSKRGQWLFNLVDGIRDDRANLDGHLAPGNNTIDLKAAIQKSKRDYLYRHVMNNIWYPFEYSTDKFPAQSFTSFSFFSFFAHHFAPRSLHNDLFDLDEGVCEMIFRWLHTGRDHEFYQHWFKMTPDDENRARESTVALLGIPMPESENVGLNRSSRFKGKRWYKGEPDFINGDTNWKGYFRFLIASTEHVLERVKVLRSTIERIRKEYAVMYPEAKGLVSME